MSDSYDGGLLDKTAHEFSVDLGLLDRASFHDSASSRLYERNNRHMAVCWYLDCQRRTESGLRTLVSNDVIEDKYRNTSESLEETIHQESVGRILRGKGQVVQLVGSNRVRTLNTNLAFGAGKRMFKSLQRPA